MLFVRLFCCLFVCWGEMLGIVFVFVRVTLFEVFGWWGFCVKMGVSGTCEWWRGSWGKRDGMTYCRGMRKCLRGMYTNTGWNVACKNNNVYLYKDIYIFIFSSPSWRSLNLSKRSRITPKKVTSRTARYRVFTITTWIGNQTRIIQLAKQFCKMNLKKYIWQVLNPHPVAHLLAIYSGKWPSFAHLLITKHQPDIDTSWKWLCVTEWPPMCLLLQRETMQAIRYKMITEDYVMCWWIYQFICIYIYVGMQDWPFGMMNIREDI